MRDTSRLLAAAAVAVALATSLGALPPATAQTVPKQIQLTARQVEGFIAAQQKIAAAKADAELEAIAKAHGFASLEQFDEVEANILLVLDGIDPKTKAFAEPSVQIRRRIDQIRADKSMPEAERKKSLEELNQVLKNARPVQFPVNVELVKKYYDRLQAVLQ
jgi:hypothetical protein